MTNYQRELFLSNLIILSDSLRKMGLNKESEYVIKLSTPIDDIYYSDIDSRHKVKKEEPLPISPELNQEDLDIYHYEGAYRDLFLNIKEMIDIFVVPEQLRPKGSNFLPSGIRIKSISDFNSGIEFADNITAKIAVVLEQETLYYSVDPDNRLKITKYIDEQANNKESALREYLIDTYDKLDNGKINIIWGLFDNASEHKDIKTATPFWLAHDIYHAYYSAVFTSSNMHYFDNQAQRIMRKTLEPENHNIYNIANKYTPGLAADDIEGTLFAMLITGKGTDELKEIIPADDYNELQKYAVASIEGLVGEVFFLP
jgi:hypothetical protein